MAMVEEVSGGHSSGPPEPGSAILAARDVSKLYGSFRAVSHVDLDIQAGSIHALIGPNGAGKSTLIAMLGGQTLPSSGEIYFKSKSLGRMAPNARARAGIGRSFQLTSIIPGFSCLENVLIAVQAHRGLSRLLGLRSRARDVEHSEELLELVGLGGARETPAELLAHGQQRQLEIAIALGARPEVLLLDEPSSGMSQHDRGLLPELLRKIVARATIVMAEHDVHLVRTIATKVTAFAEGKKIAEGGAEEVFQSPEVQRVFLRGVRNV